MPHKVNDKGFAALEAVLILVIVILVGFVGWFVWHSNQQTKATLDSASKTAQSSPNKVTKKATAISNSSPASTQQYLVIKEWGVEMPITTNIHDATYASWGNNQSEFGLSTESLTALDTGCAANNAGAGELARQTTSEHDQNAPMNNPLGYPVLDTKIGSYYYSYISPQGACSNNQTATNQQLALINAFKAAFKEIKAIN